MVRSLCIVFALLAVVSLTGAIRLQNFQRERNIRAESTPGAAAAALSAAAIADAALLAESSVTDMASEMAGPKINTSSALPIDVVDAQRDFDRAKLNLKKYVVNVQKTKAKAAETAKKIQGRADSMIAKAKADQMKRVTQVTQLKEKIVDKASQIKQESVELLAQQAESVLEEDRVRAAILSREVELARENARNVVPKLLGLPIPEEPAQTAPGAAPAATAAPAADATKPVLIEKKDDKLAKAKAMADKAKAKNAAKAKVHKAKKAEKAKTAEKAKKASVFLEVNEEIMESPALVAMKKQAQAAKEAAQRAVAAAKMKKLAAQQKVAKMKQDIAAKMAKQKAEMRMKFRQRVIEKEKALDIVMEQYDRAKKEVAAAKKLYEDTQKETNAAIGNMVKGSKGSMVLVQGISALTPKSISPAAAAPAAKAATEAAAPAAGAPLKKTATAGASSAAKHSPPASKPQTLGSSPKAAKKDAAPAQPSAKLKSIAPTFLEMGSEITAKKASLDSKVTHKLLTTLLEGPEFDMSPQDKAQFQQELAAKQHELDETWAKNLKAEEANAQKVIKKHEKALQFHQAKMDKLVEELQAFLDAKASLKEEFYQKAVEKWQVDREKAISAEIAAKNTETVNALKKTLTPPI